MHQLSRRRCLGGTGAVAASAVAAPCILAMPGALAQDKPAELIVRAWGGVWVEALERASPSRSPRRPASPSATT